MELSKVVQIAACTVILKDRASCMVLQSKNHYGSDHTEHTVHDLCQEHMRTTVSVKTLVGQMRTAETSRAPQTHLFDFKCSLTPRTLWILL